MDEVLRACVGGPPENESPEEDVEESVPDKRVHAGVEKLDPSCPFSRLPIIIIILWPESPVDEVLRACVGGPPENESPEEDVEESVPDKRVHAGVEKLDPSCPFSRLPIVIRKPQVMSLP